MAALSNRLATKRVEDVLLSAINLTLRERQTVATVAALRALATRGASASQAVVGGRLVYVTSLGLSCEWDAYSTDDDDNATVFAPTDGGTAGRWLARSNPGGSTPLRLRGDDVTTITNGYLRHVALFEGEREQDELEGRIFANRPCVLLEFVRRTKERKSTKQGALALCDFQFQIWIVDFNARGNMVAQRGSPIAAEASRSPGAYAIAGDLEDLLDGVLGEQLGEAGIGFARTGTLSLIDKRLGSRGRIILQLELGVWASTGKTDPDATDLEGIDVQMQIAIPRPPGEEVDSENVIVSGLTVSVGAGLSRAPADGSALVGDAVVTVSGAALHTFTAWADTYRDLDGDGAFTYTAVPIGADAPDQAAGTLRVGYTRTSSAAVVDDVLLAPTLRDDGDPIPIEP